MFPRNTDEQVCLFEEFNLKATIDHSGTLQGGHYWAYIKDEGNHGWLKYNFDTHCYNPSQKKSLSVLYLCHCFVVSFCIGIYNFYMYLYFFYLIHDAQLNILLHETK